MSRLKTELQFLRKKGALKSSSNSEQQQQPEEGITNNGRCCARCRTGLGRIINRGALCKSCRQRVCKACREYNLQRTSTAITGTDWVCTVCYKNATVEAASGEWMNAFVRRPSRQRFSKDGVDGGEIVARGIRRSWTISNPSSSKDESSDMKSHPVQVYHHHPTTQQHQSIVLSRKEPDDAIWGAPDPSEKIGSRVGVPVPGLVWEPRDPPLKQYSVTQLHHHQQQPGKSRLEPRRSASLSQADLVAYDGKLLLNLSQSPLVRPSHDSASRYQDYYETKYEKPVRIKADSAAIPANAAPSRQSRTIQQGSGVDVDAVWKSRWRSTSPPPAPVDDWLPIKPPQLAWAKPAIPIEAPARRSKSSRIPVPMPNSLARSASSDMDHMIYLERDLPLRERTRSIDRGLTQQYQYNYPQQQQSQKHRVGYKTYEEELADYQGRTGSVDRLAHQHRGRPRTNIRMGTQVGNGGRSVPVSLERRHSEVGSSSAERSASTSSRTRDSSNSSTSRNYSTNLRRGSSSVEITSEMAVRRNNNNINRVYIDGQPSSHHSGDVQLRNNHSQQPAAAIRVTMTDTRSLKRTTNRAAAPHPPSQEMSQQQHESSTIPRMSNKRHGQIQMKNVRPTGIIQPMPPPPPVHPGSTTVYLAQDQPPGFDGAIFRKVTPKRIKTDGEGVTKATGTSTKHTSTRTVEDRVTHVREVRDAVISVSTQPTAELAYPYHVDEDDDEEECQMQDVSVQTSETGQDDDDERQQDAEVRSEMSDSNSAGTPRKETPATGHQSTISNSALYQNSDTASDLGGLMDSDKIHPEGDDYKIVFISSDSSKSGDSLEGSFDATDHSRQASSLHDSESVTGFIDENDWLAFASAGKQHQANLLKNTSKTNLNTSSSSSGRRQSPGDSRSSTTAGLESPRTEIFTDDFGWNSDDGHHKEVFQQQTVESRDCQVQTDLSGSFDGDFEAEAFNAEYETINHYLRPGPEAIPIWQVPASSRASTQSLLSETSTSTLSAHLLREQYGFNRTDSKRSSAERSVEELNFHDHIFGNGQEPGISGNSNHNFISSLYSPDGLALPGFQEYRDQILNEIQAYTQKGDWNLSTTGTEARITQDAIPIRNHPTGPHPNSSFLAGPLLGKISNLNYRIRPTCERTARWRGLNHLDLSSPGTATLAYTTPPLEGSIQLATTDITEEPFHLPTVPKNSKSVCLPPLDNPSSLVQTVSPSALRNNQSTVPESLTPSNYILTTVDSGHNPNTPEDQQRQRRDSPSTSNQAYIQVTDTQLAYHSTGDETSLAGSHLESSLNIPSWKSGPPRPQQKEFVLTAVDDSSTAKTNCDATYAGGIPHYPRSGVSEAVVDHGRRMEKRGGDGGDDVIGHCCCGSQVSHIASCPRANTEASLDSSITTLSPDLVATPARLSHMELGTESHSGVHKESSLENGLLTHEYIPGNLASAEGLAASAPMAQLEGHQPQLPLNHAAGAIERHSTCSPTQQLESSSSDVNLDESSPTRGSRFEVSVVQESQPGRTQRLLSDSDVPTSGDESSGPGGGFDADTQHETVHDLRQFAAKQQKQQQQQRSSPSSSVAAMTADSDTDSSSSSQQKRSGSSVTASPVLSDGRSTPRRSNGQYTSYVLIKPTPTVGDQVISDDESGVTVTLPKPPTSACVVEVPASVTTSTNSWPEESDSEANEESSTSCVTISGNGVLTDHDLATSDDDTTQTDQGGASVSGGSKLAKYFTHELEAGFDSSARRQPVVHRSDLPLDRAQRHSPDPYEEEDLSLNSMEEQSVSLDQDTLQYESDPSEGGGSRLDSIDDGESFYSESGASSGDEVYMDQEEELRGYNRAIDFTLHTILEESCEESDGGERKSRSGDRRVNKEPSSELEKYFTQGLGAGGQEEANKRRSYANEESEYSDTFSETSSSIYSEGMEASGGEEEEVDPVDLASSRLEKYFRTNFLGIEGAQYPFPVPGSRTEMAPSSDGSESVGSDSEGHPSPEQQRRRKVMKARGVRQQAKADWSKSSLVGSDLDEEGSLSADPDSATSNHIEHHSVSSTDSEEEEEEEEIVMEKTDGQFDTIKRRKKKRSAGEHHAVSESQIAVEKQLAIIEDQVQQAEVIEVPATTESHAAAVVEFPAPIAEDVPTEGLDPNCPRKYQSRDSGFVGSCDDLLNSDSQKDIRQRRSSDSGSSDGNQVDKQMDPKNKPISSSPSAGSANHKGSVEIKPDESDSKSGKSVGSSGSSGDLGGSLTSTSQSSKSGKLSRKDSFNNWSSDEETNLMMNKMRALFRNMVSGGGADGSTGEKVKPPQLVVFETELTRLMKSVPGINDQQVKEIVEYLSSEDTWSDSYDSSDYTGSDLEAAGVAAAAAFDHQSVLHILPDSDRSELQQQISASCQEIIEKFDLDRSPDGSHMQINAVGSSNVPWLPVGEDASNSLNKETAFVYQRLVNSLMRFNSLPKSPGSVTPTATPGDKTNVQPSESTQQLQNSPPVIAKVLHHIGNRLVALMHEVSASSPDTTSQSGSLDEDAQSAGRLKELRLAAHFEPVTSSPRLNKVGRHYVGNKDHGGSDDKRSLSTSVDSEDTPTDTEQSPDSSDDSRSRKKKSGDPSGIKFGFESLHTYEKRISSSLPPQLGNAEQQSRGLRSDGFSSLESAESRGIVSGGSRSLKARLAERSRTVEAERRRLAEDQEAACAQVAEEETAEEDRFYKKARKLPRFSLLPRASSSNNREALQSSSSGVSDIAEEKEDDFSGWRSSFESAIAADSRTKLSLEAKMRSAGSASSSELFASTGELLDHDSSRLRVRSSGHSSKFSLPNLLERDAVRMARERERERSASSDVLLSTSPVASNPTLSSIADQQTGTEDEDSGWDRLLITRLSSKRRSSVPDTREERGSAEEQPRSTTLPRSSATLSAVDNDLDLGSSSSPSISASTAGVKKSLSLLLSHSTTNSTSESSLNTSVDTPVRSARYRPPGFRGSPAENTTPRVPPRTPQRAPSAPRLESFTPRSSGSTASSSRRNIRSMLADERKEPYSSSPSFIREGLRTSVASSAASGESFSSVSASDTLDDSELSASQANKSRSSSLSALGTRSDSMASVYSAAGEARYGTVAVRGEIQFGLHYNYRQTALEVFIKQCRDLAPVDTKRNRSDPYAKLYLLPDRSKSGKRKTKVKKHTLSPMFEENLKFTTSLSDLENRTLWLTVWHSDMFGRNDFLGEITLPLAGRIFDDPTPHWYQLQERSDIADEFSATPTHRGDIIVALKYLPGESSPSKRTKKSKGALHVIVKEAKGLIAARPNGNIDALCKGTLMPEKGKTTKHKTGICRRTSNPVWNNTFIFDDVSHQELKERALELGIWNHDRLATKEFLGGIRLNLGTGLFQGKPAEWMDAAGKELTLWSAVVERAGLWVEGSVPLRTSMERMLGD